MRVEGTEAGMSNIETQNWIPRPSTRKRVNRSLVTKGQLVFMAIHESIMNGVIKLYDGDIRVPYSEVPKGKELARKLTDGIYTMRLSGGDDVDGSILNEIFSQYMKRRDEAWSSVHGGEIS